MFFFYKLSSLQVLESISCLLLSSVFSCLLYSAKSEKKKLISCVSKCSSNFIPESWYPACNNVQFRIPDKGEALCSTSDERILLKDLHIPQHDQSQIIVDFYINTENGEFFNVFALEQIL